MISYILAVITGLAIVGIDQYTKLYIATNFEMARSYEFIPGLIDITYIYNDGGAWGMLSGYTWLLISLTIVIMLVCVALILKYGVRNKLLFWAVILVLSGGVGNMIDRIFRSGNVIDFLHFEFMPNFPVFNVADCAIVVGAALMMIYFFDDLVSDQKNKRKALLENFSQAESNEENK